MLDETVNALRTGAPSLTSLDLRGGFSEGSFLPVADAIRTKGAWERLRVLQIEDRSNHSISRSGLNELFGAIGGAHGCPNLRELAVTTRNGSVGAVASAIGMGAFAALETLRFSDENYAPKAEEEEVAALEAALQGNPLPSLRTLEIRCEFQYAPLVRAFRGDACANLRRMGLKHGSMDLGELAQVLNDGWGRHLRTLTLSGPRDAIARIVEAVACSGACPALQELEASILRPVQSTPRTFMGAVLPPKDPAHDAMVQNLATILSGGAACSSHLVKLSLCEWDIDLGDMRVLSRAALSLLTSARIAILHLRSMKRLGDASVRQLMRAMQRGLGMWLREVNLDCSAYNRQLFTDLDSWCPHLEEVVKVLGCEDIITARARQRRTRMLW